MTNRPQEEAVERQSEGHRYTEAGDSEVDLQGRSLTVQKIQPHGLAEGLREARRTLRTLIKPNPGCNHVTTGLCLSYKYLI